MLCAPVSTVHSWRQIGIPASRLAHLKLAAEAANKTIDWDNPPPFPVAGGSADANAERNAA